MPRKKNRPKAMRRHSGATGQGRARSGPKAQPWLKRLRGGLDTWLHPQACDERPWKLLPWLLGLAFAARAAVALSGDFVLHPDEIMQYLEPAHRLAFGNGVVYWEYHYGARSWLVPGAVAGILKLFDAVGLGQPFWYVGGVKLAFCALSLGIPAGMYFFARRHFGEASARVALLAGAFWYELAGFAHKPMTEFVATVPLMALLVLCVRPVADRARGIWILAFLAVLTAGIRMQYAPLALGLLGIVYWQSDRKRSLVMATGVMVLAVGVFDALTWNGGLFHSYVTNLGFNLIHGGTRTGESPFYQYLVWLAIAGGGLSVLTLVAALRSLRRYGFLLVLIGLVLLVHSLQAHKEYRFAFAVIPLWLLVGSDIVARWAAGTGSSRARTRGAVVLFAAVTLAGAMNILPFQQQVYRSWSRETGTVGFVRGQDPIFAAYRYLARAPAVVSVWQPDRPYFSLPAYYYLHRSIPFYDSIRGSILLESQESLPHLVSHIVTEDLDLFVPGYSLERNFGGVRILRRDNNERPVRTWLEYAPIAVPGSYVRILRKIDPQTPSLPDNWGIRFSDRNSESSSG